jgi:riboflavin kinase/FMN adenylyltransferase
MFAPRRRRRAGSSDGSGMRIFQDYRDLPEAARGAVVAIGNFDGVHLGHQAVIGEAGRIARSLGAPQAVLTFEPHPRHIFRPQDPPFRLTPFGVKARLLGEVGVDLLFAQHFDRDFASKTAEDFVEHVLVEGLGVRHVVTGYDFVFGHRRHGTTILLSEMGRRLGFGVSVLEPVQREEADEIYSATHVRTHLEEGRPREAAALLGRDWEIEGTVETGDRLGRTLGYPTANIGLGEYLRPKTGIYAVRAMIVGAEEEGWRDAVASLGYRPTVGGTDLRFEVHLFDFDGDLYGRQLRVAFVDYLRPEAKFPDLASLKVQMDEDSRRARAVLAGN